MSKFRAVVPAVVGAAVFASAAQAADVIPVMPPAPPPVVIQPVAEEPFDGPYVGILLGHVWAYKDWYFTQFDTTTNHRASGSLLGIEAGFRFQTNNLVFGIEADWAWTNANGNSLCPNAQNFDDTCSTDIHWLATITGQAGFALGNVLLYGEAGFAFARETLTAVGPTTFTATTTNSGWLLGAGAVARLGDGGLYLKAEYNYVNFGTENIVLTDGVLEDPVDLTQRAHILKIGIGLQF